MSFPNLQEAPAGEKADLYFFDLSIGDWAVWGTGTVSPDGTQIVSDPGFGLPRFAWHFAAFSFFVAQALADEVRPRGQKAGEPVDLPTGRFTVRKTDLVLPGRLPVTIARTYRSENPRPGLFGVGWNLAVYESVITVSATGTTLSLILGDQSAYRLAPAGPGQWQNTTEPFLRGAVVTQPSGATFQLRFKDGTMQRFDQIQGFSNLFGLTAITDRTGNTVTISREAAVAPAVGRRRETRAKQVRENFFSTGQAGRKIGPRAGSSEAKARG
ncbi:MAG: DUF6531 domain-containing protein [Candidatus Methylomirabilia bacterium]